MPLFSKINISQTDNWCWVFQSAKAVLVTSFEILDIQRCAWDGLLGVSQSYKNPWENPFLLSCWCILKMRGRTSYPRLLQQMNLRFIILKWGQNGNPWNGTILSHPGRKSDKCHCQCATLLSVSSGTVKEWFLLLQCWEGRQSSPTPTSRSWQNSEGISDEFSLTRIQQKSCIRQWRLQTSLKTWESITEFGWTVLPHPPHSPIKHPQIFYLCGVLKDTFRSMKFETNDSVTDAMRTWLCEQDSMVQTRDGRACSSLA